MSPEISSVLVQSQCRPLRSGEARALALHIEALEQRLDAASRWEQDHEQALRKQHVELYLDNSTLMCRFPGGGTVRLPSGLTQHQRADAMQLLVTLLAERLPGTRAPIASPGAPTQADLRALAQALRKAPAKTLPGPKAKPSREEALDLLLSIEL